MASYRKDKRAGTITVQPGEVLTSAILSGLSIRNLPYRVTPRHFPLSAQHNTFESLVWPSRLFESSLGTSKNARLLPAKVCGPHVSLAMGHHEQCTEY